MDNQKYAQSIKLIGVMHKETGKLYMTSVLWSDQNEIVVYRSLKDFKELHKKLKKRFPPANPLKKSDRVVPKFKVKRAKRNVRKKGPSKSVLRLKALERYCNGLMTCDPRVAQSEEFRQFFLPNDRDLSSEFAKNSIMVMPSDDTQIGDRGGGGGSVTQPFVTETYRCVAPYETKDTKNQPFKVDIDETVDVLIKDKAGWWLVENTSKSMAWFPAPYLEKADGDNEDEIDNNGGVLYCLSKKYTSKSADELSVDIGSVVEVLQKSENGWWLVRHNHKTGYVPSMYMQPYNNPRVQLPTSLRGHHGSRLNLAQLQVPSPGLGAGSAPGLLQTPSSQQLSHSQGNLLQLPDGSSIQHSAQGLNPQDRYKSRSLNILEPDDSIYQTPSSYAVRTPGIQVETSVDSSDSSEFSFSDDDEEEDGYTSGGFTSGSDSLSASRGDMEDELRRSRTPPPPVRNRNLLTPDSGLSIGGRLQPSRSDPNLAKGPATPKVPPRPPAQDILKRCTTVTRKNVMGSRNQLSAPSVSVQAR